MSKEDSIEIFDDQRFSNEKLDYAQIIMRQVLRITSLGSTELKGGHYTEENGIREYLPSSRDQFNNGVKRLEDLLTPYIDKEYMEKLSEFHKEYLNEHNEMEAEKRDRETLLDLTLDFNRTKFRLLCRLMQRMNLLLSNAKAGEVLK